MEDRISPNELRIGNFIDCGGLHVPYGIGEVAEICADSVVVKINEKYHSYLYDDLKPIPLSEDWLIQFGFECFRDGWYSKRLFSWNIYDKELRWNGHSLDCKYVHQLQNFYWCIYETELNLISKPAQSGENQKG